MAKSVHGCGLPFSNSNDHCRLSRVEIGKDFTRQWVANYVGSPCVGWFRWAASTASRKYIRPVLPEFPLAARCCQRKRTVTAPEAWSHAGVVG